MERFEEGRFNDMVKKVGKKENLPEEVYFNKGL